MPKVVVLSKDIADKIAAGEVVDRPSSVVKELVENSLDAGATRIEIDLEEGGKRRISVTDNGCGMELDDAVLALERHATSKIRTEEDLYSIRTLGFRGEALPSIAAVSNLRIRTRAADAEVGVELSVERGQVSAAEQRGGPQGTQVVVTDLFGSVPARLKFLKGTQTELSHILDLVVRFALSYPEVHFRLTHNSRPLFSTPGSGDPLNTVVAAYGREVAREMIPVHSVDGSPVAVHGFVSRPAVTRASRAHQSWFVNGRIVRSPMLSRALDEAYKGRLPAGRHPVSCLFLATDPGAVDVNVHPTKMEVRFAAERDVFEAVLHSVRAALEGTGLAVTALGSRPNRVEQAIRAQTTTGDPFGGESVREVATTYGPPRATGPVPPAAPPRTARPFELRSPEAQPALSLDSDPFAPRPDAPLAAAPRPAAQEDTAAGQVSYSAAEGEASARLPELSPIARVLDTYVVCEGPDALYIIDQHAAHERIVYDALLRRDADDVAPQQLLIPHTLSLSRADAAVLEAHRERLNELGFEIEPFGRDTFVLRSVPMLLVGKSYGAVLQDVIDDLRERERSGRLEDERAEVCALVACHSVTRSGDPMSQEEMRQLVQELRESPSPYTCAHGRPTMLVLSRAEIERKIGRG